jgi:hypothetical protein
MAPFDLVGQTEVDGLPLGEADYVALSQELAVRAAVDDGTIERQLARTESRDRHDALAFVAPALSAEPSARESFFRTISDARTAAATVGRGGHALAPPPAQGG